jgi:hypothetical protein
LDRFDAGAVQGDFADNADWQNAFGVRMKGSANILRFLAMVVKRPNVQARRTSWDEPVVRFLRSDVALAFRTYRTVESGASPARPSRTTTRPPRRLPK